MERRADGDSLPATHVAEEQTSMKAENVEYQDTN
jgi:hypothetical protein